MTPLGSILCRLGLHRWYIRRATRFHTTRGLRDLQVLRCARCGAQRERTVGA